MHSVDVRSQWNCVIVKELEKLFFEFLIQFEAPFVLKVRVQSFDGKFPLVEKWNNSIK